jgi:hypothetical protein
MAAPGPPVFVVGTPRSGTTLLSEILGAHPAIAMAPETHYYNSFASTCDREDCLAEAGSRERYVDRLFSSETFGRMDLPEATRGQVMEALGEDEATHADVLGPILAAFASVHGASRPGEKTPRHIEWVPQILGDFPEARIVSVVRDPRDVALSQGRAPWESTVWRSAKEWRRHQGLAADYMGRFPDRFREVRYEDLLEDPSGTAREVCEFADLPYEEQMLDFHESGSATFDGESEPWKRKASEPIDPSNKEKWRDQMPPEERWVVEHVDGEGMEDRGYGRSDPALGIGGRLRLAGLYGEHMVRWGRHQARWILETKILPPDYGSPYD